MQLFKTTTAEQFSKTTTIWRITVMMWRLSRSIPKSWFLGKSNGIDIAIFWSKCDSIKIQYHPPQVHHAECGGVHISVNPITQSAEEFISSTQNIGAEKIKWNRNQIFKNKNWIKNHNRHITKLQSTVGENGTETERYAIKTWLWSPL